MPRPCAYASVNITQINVNGFMGYLKGKSTVLIYQRYTNLMLKYRHREFWCTGYYVDTVGKNTKKIKEYIANQLKEDKRIEQNAKYIITLF